LVASAFEVTETKSALAKAYATRLGRFVASLPMSPEEAGVVIQGAALGPEFILPALLFAFARSLGSQFRFLHSHGDHSLADFLKETIDLCKVKLELYRKTESDPVLVLLLFREYFQRGVSNSCK